MPLYEVNYFPFEYWDKSTQTSWTYNKEIALKHVRKHAAMIGYSIVIGEWKHLSQLIRDTDGNVRYAISELLPGESRYARSAFGGKDWLS